MKEFHFSTLISASKEAVWATLWEDQSQRDWGNLIDEGMHIKGELIEGNEVQFLSGNGYGVTSLVERLVPNEFVRFRHKADTRNMGRQERANEWTGGAESYTLSKEANQTKLTIAIEIPSELEEIMSLRLPESLARIKTLAEARDRSLE